MKEITIYTIEKACYSRKLQFKNEEEYKTFLENRNFWDFEVDVELYDNEVDDIEVSYNDEDIDLNDFKVSFEDLQ